MAFLLADGLQTYSVTFADANDTSNTTIFQGAVCETCIPIYVPTVSEWGLIILSLITLIIGVVSIREQGAFEKSAR